MMQQIAEWVNVEDLTEVAIQRYFLKEFFF